MKAPMSKGGRWHGVASMFIAPQLLTDTYKHIVVSMFVVQENTLHAVGVWLQCHGLLSLNKVDLVKCVHLNRLLGMLVEKEWPNSFGQLLRLVYGQPQGPICSSSTSYTLHKWHWHGLPPPRWTEEHSYTLGAEMLG